MQNCRTSKFQRPTGEKKPNLRGLAYRLEIKISKLRRRAKRDICPIWKKVLRIQRRFEPGKRTAKGADKRYGRLVLG